MKKLIKDMIPITMSFFVVKVTQKLHNEALLSLRNFRTKVASL